MNKENLSITETSLLNSDLSWIDSKSSIELDRALNEDSTDYQIIYAMYKNKLMAKLRTRQGE